MMSEGPPSTRLSFHGGVSALALLGAPDERGFWPIVLGALCVSLLLARDRTRWSETVIRSMSQEIVALMILAWLLSGVLSELLRASGNVGLFNVYSWGLLAMIAAAVASGYLRGPIEQEPAL